MGSKETILGRIRAAGVGSVVAARRPVETGAVDLDRFCEYLADYRATVYRPEVSELGAVLTELVEGKRVVVPEGFPMEFVAGVEGLEVDRGFSTQELDGFDAALTLCALGIEETGTLVLDSGAGQGRRAVTLIPDHHICLVDPNQVVQSVAEAVDRLDPSAPLTFISGPSATSDIELVRVEGVHGPRRLDVVVCAYS